MCTVRPVVVPLTAPMALPTAQPGWFGPAPPSHPGQWVSFVDVTTGELFNVHNQVRFLEGTLSARHDLRGPSGGFDVSVQDLEVSGAEGGTDTPTARVHSPSKERPRPRFTDGADFDVYHAEGPEASHLDRD